MITDAEIEKELNKAADIFNRLTAKLEEKYGKEAFIYVESEGRFYAMRCAPRGRDGNSQDDIIVTSKPCRFDCGAW